MRDYSSTPKELETAAVSLLLLSLGILSFGWIDLQDDVTVHEVRIFNRLDDAMDRASCLAISASEDGKTWSVLHQKTDKRIFGGADGTPYIWATEEGVRARFVRITVLGKKTYLHFSQVQVYGSPD